MSSSPNDPPNPIDLGSTSGWEEFSVVERPLLLPKVRKWEVSIPMKREGARVHIALSLLYLFAAEIIGPLLLVQFFGLEWETAKEFMHIAIPSTLGLLGSAMGFYFGSDSKIVDGASTDNGG